MKNFFIILMLLFFVTTVYARKPRRSPVELGLKGNMYIDYFSDGSDFSIGTDIIFNPSQNLGFRVGFTELYFFEETTFDVNLGGLLPFTKLEMLIYIPAGRVQPYVHSGFGLITVSDLTYLVFGGGLGLDCFVADRTSFSLEPGVYVMHMSGFGSSDTEAGFRLSLGMKFGITR